MSEFIRTRTLIALLVAPALVDGRMLRGDSTDDNTKKSVEFLYAFPMPLLFAWLEMSVRVCFVHESWAILLANRIEAGSVADF